VAICLPTRLLHHSLGLYRHLKSIEKAAVIDAFHLGLVGQAVQDELRTDIDAHLLRIESPEPGPGPAPDRAARMTMLTIARAGTGSAIPFLRIGGLSE